MRSSWIPFAFLGLSASAWVGCFSDSSGPAAGTLAGPCRADKTCNAGLVCSANQCIQSIGACGPTDAQAPVDAASSDDGSVAPDSGSPPSDDGGSSVTDAPAADESTPTPGTNLITNGDFSQGQTLWGLVSGSAPIAVNNGELCVTLSANSGVTLAWPQQATMPAPVLSMSASYTFSYKARASQMPVTVDAKVGHTESPFTADFETGNDGVTTSLQTFTHMFTPPQDDSSTGLAFSFSSPVMQDVCFQSVSLVQN